VWGIKFIIEKSVNDVSLFEICVTLPLFNTLTFVSNHKKKK